MGGEGGGNYCSREVLGGSWDAIHRFSLAARADFAVDGDQRLNVSIVIRRVVAGRSVEVREVCDVSVSAAFLRDRD